MDIDDLTPRQPWERQVGETARNFHNFCHYLHLVEFRRSMRQAHHDHQTVCLQKNPPKNLAAPPNWQALRFKFSWPERAEAHDRHLAERNRLQRIHAIDQMNLRHVQFAMDLQSLGVERLKQYLEHKTLATLTPLQLATLLDKASAVERRAMGEATVITKDLNAQADAAALDLSALTADELQMFEQLVRKATPQPVLVTP